jgi:hypothetical protein
LITYALQALGLAKLTAQSQVTITIEVLRYLTSPVIQRELWIYLSVYNVIRILMARAAHASVVHRCEI